MRTWPAEGQIFLFCPLFKIHVSIVFQIYALQYIICTLLGSREAEPGTRIWAPMTEVSAFRRKGEKRKQDRTGKEAR